MPTPDGGVPVFAQPTVSESPHPAQSSPGDLTGERFGDYLLQGELGRGGMGVVYKAFEPGLERYVAIKMAHAGASSDPGELQRFHTEASAAARLNHPNIVKVHRVGVQDNCHYFSMDYIAGPSLAQRLTEGPLPGRTAAKYLVAVAWAIQHAHAQGILHRDLKPSNILLDADDQPHVADFGLAKQLSADKGQTRTGAVLGTPGYMAPEQATGSKELTPRTDIYGLGALLYELITARPPFRGETALDTVLQVLQNDPAPPRLLNPRIDRDLETICLKCLAKSPRDRYPSAEALAADLQRYLTGESIEARSLNMLDYLGRALERSHFDVEFRGYGNVLLWFAGIVGVMHLVTHVATVHHLHEVVIMGLHAVQFALMVLVLWAYRTHGLWPQSMAERQLWAVWIGYILTCTMLSLLVRQLFGAEAPYEGKLYPLFCLVSGMAFLILGSSYWGMCNVFAAAFYLLAVLLCFGLYWGTLAFGGLWTVVLVLIGLRLRWLGQDNERAEKQTAAPSGSSRV